MVGAGNGIDPSGDVRVARLAADGTWEAFGSDEGVPEGSEGRWPSLAVGGDTVLVSAFTGLVRGEGDRFVTLWQDPTAVVQPSFEVAFGQVPDGVLAVSADEVWLPAAPEVGASPWLVAGTTLSRYRDGRWASVGPVSPGDTASAPVLATDGAIWQATPQGLVRIEGDDWAVVAEDIGGYARVSLAAGDDGSVWTISDGDVVTVRPDGSRTSIGRPQGSKRLFEGLPLAAGAGVVWTADSDPTRGLAWLHRWDGQWSDVGVPEPYTWVTQLLVAAGWRGLGDPRRRGCGPGPRPVRRRSVDDRPGCCPRSGADPLRGGVQHPGPGGGLLRRGRSGSRCSGEHVPRGGEGPEHRT